MSADRLRGLLDVGQLAKAYGIPLVDYQRDGWGLLVTSGAGGMLAGMDAVIPARWCVSSEGLPARAPDAWLSFADAAAQLVSVTAAYCLFGMDLPEPVTQILEFFLRTAWSGTRTGRSGTAPSAAHSTS